MILKKEILELKKEIEKRVNDSEMNYTSIEILKSRLQEKEKELIKTDLELKIELTKELAKIVKLGLNKHDTTKMTNLANSIWSNDNIDINYKFYLKDLKSYLKDYKKFYIIKAE